MSTKDNLEREAEAAQSKLHEAADSVKSGAYEAADEAQRTANAYAEHGKAVAATSLVDFASAVRRASDELSERDQGVAARLASQAASSLEDIAGTVSQTSLNDAMGQVKSFARRNPAAFIGGAVLAGLAVGRLLRASGERTHAIAPAQPQHAAYQPPAAYSPSAAPVAPANPLPK